jgi:hypothetical protein
MWRYGYGSLNNGGELSRFQSGVLTDGGTLAAIGETDELYYRLVTLGLYNSATLINSCNAGKESVLYNFKPTPVQALDRFIGTRNSTVVALGSDGEFVDLPVNFPPVEWNVDGSYRGLRPQSQATNLFVASDPSTSPATGTKTAITFGVNDWGLGFNGKTIFGDNSTARVYYNATLSASTLYSFSFFIKPNNGVQPTFGNAGSNIGRFVLSGTSITSGYTVASTSVPGVFYVTGSGTTGVSNLSVNGFIKQTGNSAIGFEITRIQIEAGPIATSHIITNGVAVLREGDVLKQTGLGSVLGTSGYIALAFENRNTGTARVLFDAWEDASNYVRIGINASNQLVGSVVTGGVEQAAITSSTLVNGTKYGVVLSRDTDQVLMSLSGVQVGTTDTTATMPTISKGNLGCSLADDQWANAWIRGLVIEAAPMTITDANALSLSLSTL